MQMAGSEVLKKDMRNAQWRQDRIIEILKLETGSYLHEMHWHFDTVPVRISIGAGAA